MKLGRFDAYIFDLDGTLINSGKYHAQAFADAVWDQSGYRITPDEHVEFFASHSLRFSKVLNERYGLSLNPEKVLAFKRNRVQEVFKAELFPGALAFLEFWRHKKPLALATNSPLSFVKPALEQIGLFDYFDVITTADDVVKRKPDSEIFDVTVEHLGIAPKSALVFEDQLVGIDAARDAGTAVIAIDNGQPIFYPVDIAVYTWNELLKLSEQG